MSKKKDVDTVELQRVQSRFEDWRSARKGREAIPEGLWEEVRVLSKKHTIGELSKALKLSHNNVKKHVLNSEVSVDSASSVDFVDLGLFRASPSSSSCTLELTNSDGISMKLSITGIPCIDVMELTQSFLGKCT